MGLAMHFEFATASRILFGAGRAAELGSLVAGYGRRVLMVVGSSAEQGNALLQQLQQEKIDTLVFAVHGEPAVPMVENAIAQAREKRCDVVCSVGGGSAIDTGKVVAAMLANPGDLGDYLEVIGRAQPMQHPAVPFIAVPTTAGTGSEVTRNAVLASREHRIKVSVRSVTMLPRLALVDPLLTHTMPPAVTATTGMDALTQLIEPYLCSQPSPLVDALVRDSIPRVASSLHRAFNDGQDAEARENMALASLFGGLALANAKLGAVHGIAGPFGGMFDAPHGAICARLLPAVLRTTLRALKMRQPEAPQIKRFDEIAALLTGDPKGKAEQGLEWIERLVEKLDIPRLSEYGFSDVDMEVLIDKSMKASSMKGHPIVLNREDLHGILEQAR